MLLNCVISYQEGGVAFLANAVEHVKATSGPPGGAVAFLTIAVYHLNADSQFWTHWPGKWLFGLVK